MRHRERRRTRIRCNPGGVWYSANQGAIALDAGATSRALDTRAENPRLHDARALAVSSLLVNFGGADNGAADEIWAGTGDTGLDGPLGPDAGRGVGVFRAKLTIATGVATSWALEAKSLAGTVVLSLARQPDGTLWAATTNGLFKRSAVAPNEWTKALEGLHWDVSVGRGHGTEPYRLWAAGDGKLQWSTDGSTFSTLALPDNFPLLPQARSAPGHLRVAAVPVVNPAPTPATPAVLAWIFGGQGRLWRVSHTGAAPVDGAPTGSRLALALSFSPGDSDEIVVGCGEPIAQPPARPPALFDLPAPPAALYRARVHQQGSRWRFPSGEGAEVAVPFLIGTTVAPDVNAIAWGCSLEFRALWVGTDGGVFRSENGWGAFEPRTSGLARIHRANHQDRRDPTDFRRGLNHIRGVTSFVEVAHSALADNRPLNQIYHERILRFTCACTFSWFQPAGVRTIRQGPTRKRISTRTGQAPESVRRRQSPPELEPRENPARHWHMPNLVFRRLGCVVVHTAFAWRPVRGRRPKPEPRPTRKPGAGT